MSSTDSVKDQRSSNNDQESDEIQQFDGTYEGFDGQAEGEVHQLARTLTNKTHSSTLDGQELIRYLTNMSQVPGVEPYNAHEIDPRLDPDSDAFDSKFWVKNLKKLRDSDEDYYKHAKLGIGYKNLVASGIATDSDYLATVTSAIPKYILDFYNDHFNDKPERYFDILKSMDGLILPGEVTVVLGRPGSGCSTLLKTIASQTYGFKVHPDSVISYDGLTPKDIEKNHRGDVIYSAETDTHFPALKVGDTLDFAARLRTPRNRGNIDRETYAKHMAAVYMATYGLSHTRHTNVGNDFIRGVSGGERKRVSIAEVSLSGANIQCWDNATRGLDAATALEFIRALKTSATVLEATPLIAIYQCSQDAYDLFDNVVVLYEGYQIFFGKAKEAKAYFENMGYECPQRQTTADFLTSITNPDERIVKPGFENRVPRTAKEFETYWKQSPEYADLIRRIDEYFVSCETLNTKEKYAASHNAKQAKGVGSKSPYTVSTWMQIKYITHHNFLRIKGNPSIPIFSIFSQVVMGLILSSLFFNLQPTTDSFYNRGVSMFTAVFFNGFSSLLEIMSLYEARPIVEKHRLYALYRPSTDGVASIISELPVKMLMSSGFNIVFYWMVHYRRNAGRFFFYWFLNILSTLSMSHIFRTVGAFTSSLASALTAASALLIGFIAFTGFVIPTPYMLGWSRWMNYIDPLGYVFESLMTNEFHGVEYECSTYIPSGPGYEDAPLDSKICAVVSSAPGQSVVKGTNYIAVAYKYSNSHKWRNVGILVAFIVFFLATYLFAIEFNRGAAQKGEIVLFLRGAIKKHNKEKLNKDIESGPNEKVAIAEKLEADVGESNSSSTGTGVPAANNIFHWKDLTYQVKIKDEDRVILNHVDGWVKPGQLTALMGSSGAGKTTLLNCLSERLTTGVVTDGVRMVNGHPLDSSFQRSIGYAQQQDVHLDTATVRESLRFSAYLRQPASVSRQEKDDYVEYVIDLLEMRAYADAVVGNAGEGLNVEQRKRLTIGVELAAKPKLLLFLDEPTSGLDSQTAWSICKLMRKLADHGQAILCTIHQPSALLLQEFDRLLFLQKGGQTVYFGDLGENCQTLIDYFEGQGADPCPKEANPAEWMLHVVGAAPGSHAKQDYYEVWKNSDEFKEVRKELEYMETELAKLPADQSLDAHKSYAAPLMRQYYEVTKRNVISYWRTPYYIYSKIFLAVSCALYIGFIFFKGPVTQQGLQNQVFSVFMTFIPLFSLLQQLVPYFAKYRLIYEVREAPSKTFSWVAFIGSIVTTEMIYNFLIGVTYYFCWAYPIGFYRNATYTDNVNERGAILFLFISLCFVYCGTLGHLAMSFNEIEENAANLCMLLLSLSINFSGSLVHYSSMPGFWKFLYRANPFTYVVQGTLGAGLGNAPAGCSDVELLQFPAPSGQTCGEYMSNYISIAGGKLVDPDATNCKFCTVTNTDDYLHTISVVYSQRWRNFGIFLVYIVFNIAATFLFYYLARVPKGTRQKK